MNGSIAAAVRGEFGDIRFTRRTSGGELFVNPLMSLYFAFELDAVARNCHYLDLVAPTETFREVGAVIEGYRYRLECHRPRRAIPH